jgi:ribosomal protein L37AE/L43A
MVRASTRPAYNHVMLYRILRAINHIYPVAVLWMYIGAFLLAMSLMFIFPPGTLILLWMGLVSLVGVVIVAKVLVGAQRAVARHVLSAGVCPYCGERSARVRDPAEEWRCEACGTSFLPGGAEVRRAPATPAIAGE